MASQSRKFLTSSHSIGYSSMLECRMSPASSPTRATVVSSSSSSSSLYARGHSSRQNDRYCSETKTRGMRGGSDGGGSALLQSETCFCCDSP